MKQKQVLLVTLAVLLAVSITTTLTLAQSPTGTGQARAPRTALGTGFTYQGQLKSGGSIVNGNCDIAFRLYDAASGGTMIGTAITTTVPITNGLFTTQLDFGANVFNGDARWLGLQVRCPAGSGSYTMLTARQTMTAAPYALALPGLYTQQNATSPNLIGGYNGNSVTSSVNGATIGGGGTASFINRVTDDFGTIGGGAYNQAGDNAGSTTDNNYATVGGGWYNIARGWVAVIGGGDTNTADDYATVGGGRQNSATGQYSEIGGGWLNTANNLYTTVGGGYRNSAGNQYAAVSGGYSNTASGIGAFVGGGGYDGINFLPNTATGDTSIVGGGLDNHAISHTATIGGGRANTVGAVDATIGGGWGNAINAHGSQSTIGGGLENTTSDVVSTVPGGYHAVASHYGEMAYASGSFANPGDAQTSVYVVRNLVMPGAAWTPLFLDGLGLPLTIAPTRTLTFDILVTARDQTPIGVSAGWTIRGVVKDQGGIAVMVGAPTITLLAADPPAAGLGWNVNAIAIGNMLVVQVTNGANPVPIRWVATVRTTEVNW